MRIPTEPTIVFAGAISRDFPYLERAKVDAVMVSFEKIKGSAKLKERLREGFSWNPTTYIDSGVFTFMRRAGVTVQNKNAKTIRPATFAEFREFAKSYIDYLKTDMDVWDWIIDLDCAELFGVEAEDAFRKGLRQLVGDKLLPVWHGQRGAEGWTQMIQDYPYVCIALGKGIGGRNRRNHALVRSMCREAHENGTKVHILGVSTLEHFETFEADTMDSSSWASGVRWGEIKLNRGKVMVPKFDQSQRRPLEHNKLLALAESINEFGFQVDPELDRLMGMAPIEQVGEDPTTNVREDYYTRLETGIRMLELRQRQLRGGTDGSTTLEEAG